MRSAESAHIWRACAAALMALVLAACGGGNSSVTTLSGGGASGGGGGTVVTLDTPTGPNTTEIVVDGGPPSGFALGVANVPYVTVSVCTPGSTTDCTTIDHVLLDTGSIGLRVLKSRVAGLTLPAVTVPGGNAVECFPFVLGALWGPMAQADMHVGGETASNLPIQLIDDSATPAIPAPADCGSAANGGLLNSVTSLQANGVMGIGMLKFDCGAMCVSGNYAGSYTLYYACTGAGACTPTAVPIDSQTQNPVAFFAVNNNGTIINLPALPDLGAGVAKGRLVFGIGTQTNNQISPTATMYLVDNNPANDTYLYLTSTVGTTIYPNSYIDTGSNAYFFDDPSMPLNCQNSAGSAGGWYCPTAIVRRSATFTDSLGTTGTVDFSVASADALFSTPSDAFSNLAGSVNQGAGTFVWGLPFFFGRSVYTSIWSQALSPNGPWNAF